MPSEAALTDLGRELIDSLPSYLRDVPESRALCHVFAKESERAEAAAETVRDRLTIMNADAAGLTFWERILRITPAPMAALETRRASALATYRALDGDAAGLTWEEKVNGVMAGTGWSYAAHNPADIGSPAVHTVRITAGVPASALPDLLRRIGEFTPAHVLLEIVSQDGFVLDQSQLDIQPFHP